MISSIYTYKAFEYAQNIDLKKCNNLFKLKQNIIFVRNHLFDKKAKTLNRTCAIIFAQALLCRVNALIDNALIQNLLNRKADLHLINTKSDTDFLKIVVIYAVKTNKKDIVLDIIKTGCIGKLSREKRISFLVDFFNNEVFCHKDYLFYLISDGRIYNYQLDYKEVSDKVSICSKELTSILYEFDLLDAKVKLNERLGILDPNMELELFLNSLTQFSEVEKRYLEFLHKNGALVSEKEIETLLFYKAHETIENFIQRFKVAKNGMELSNVVGIVIETKNYYFSVDLLKILSKKFQKYNGDSSKIFRHYFNKVSNENKKYILSFFSFLKSSDLSKVKSMKKLLALKEFGEAFDIIEPLKRLIQNRIQTLS